MFIIFIIVFAVAFGLILAMAHVAIGTALIGALVIASIVVVGLAALWGEL
jgi:hypothetical protein